MQGGHAHAQTLARENADLKDVLHANGPSASAAGQARIFDRFVGRWDCDYTHFDEDGSVKERYPGHLTFGWILQGQALQDVWTGDTGDGRGERQIGTSIRFFDPGTDLWTVVWIMPEATAVVRVSGGRDRRSHRAGGRQRRWLATSLVVRRSP
jgi:hypothetical protein